MINSDKHCDSFENMKSLGWNEFFERAFQPFREEGCSALRISWENRGKYRALDGSGEYFCELSGRFRFDAAGRSGYPCVGDWVAASVTGNDQRGVIQAVLPRKSAFSRKIAGEKTGEQVVAANVDTVFIVSGLDLNFNLRRIERYLAMAWNSGALPVVLLNKADLCEGETEARRSEAGAIAPGVDVHALSAAHGSGLEVLSEYLQPGRTVAFLGSSGVGKSTIINALLGEERLRVNDVSGLGSRGRHTTTSRELFVLPGRGIVIDTPGMRELQVWGDDQSLELVFEEIAELGRSCRFGDCRHENEPGCAVRAAIAAGTLDEKRFASYLKLRKEFAYLEDRQTMAASAVEKARWKEISKYGKELKKNKKKL